MTLLELKPLTSEQLPAVLKLDQQCFGGLWTQAGYEREILSPNSELLILQTVEQPSILVGLGCYWAILEEAHITIVAVEPTYHRQGIGQALVCVLLKSARQRGLERATLEVKASNRAAIALYKKFGFREAGRRRGYYPDTKEDALVLWRSQLQSSVFEQELQTWDQAIQHQLRQFGWQWFDEMNTNESVEGLVETGAMETDARVNATMRD